MVYQPLDEHRDEIRLITVLPLVQDKSESAPIECRLENLCLNGEHFTAAYKKYLIDKDAAGAWHDPRYDIERISQEEKSGDWVQLLHTNDDATTHLPEFRYEWGDFMALSYTWGGPTNIETIIVNGQPLIVSRNVAACLRVLRNKSYTKDGWKFWIDAISINQKDIIERASQVKRMRDIYTKAWTPVIWIGEQEEGSEDALNLIITLAKDYSSREGVTQLTKDLHQSADRFGKGSWRALNQIVCRPYWRRLWILQEAALGRSTTPVLCGPRTLAWTQFARAFSILGQTDEVINTYIVNELSEASLSFDLAIWPNLETVCEIQQLQDRQLKGERTSLYRLLNLTRTVSSTDPRDKVYGLLGLMDDDLVRLIKPDYRDTVIKVYHAFTIAIIEATGSLDVIRHASPNANSSFPSWVPDWTFAPENAPLNVSDAAFESGGLSRADYRVLANGQLLSCKGIIADHFDGLGCMWTKGWSADSVIPTKGTANPYGNFESARNAIWRSYVAGRSIPSEPLKADWGALLATPILTTIDIRECGSLRDLVGSNIFEWCVTSLRGNEEFQVAGRCMREYFWEGAKPEEIDTIQLRDALMQKDRVGLSRRLFTTKKGYVGIAPEGVETKDLIAVLQGCSMPMVLRKVEAVFENTTYKVIGECYVHGIMNGEALKWGLEVQDLVLC